MTWVGISAHAAFIALFVWYHVPALALFNVFSVAAWTVARITNRRGLPRLTALLLAVEVVSHAVLAVSILGWNSGFHYYLIPLVPFLVFNDELRTRIAIVGAIAVACVYLLLRATTFSVIPPSSWDASAQWIEYLNIVVPFTALTIISVYFRFGSIDAERRMEELAMTDALTRLPNRRRMREMLEAERNRFTRSGHSFAVIIGDIDGFKLINDARGHDCGDYVLFELAAILRSVLRAQDGVARWGGEEFLFLLPDTDHRGAGVVAEKLRAAVESAALSFADQTLKITMTFGVSVYSAAASTEACVRRADEALYAGKDQGKNRVVVGAELAS